MGELGLGMLADVDIDLLPVVLIIPNLLAVHAHGQDSACKKGIRTQFQFAGV